MLMISAREQSGIDKLEDTVKGLFFSGNWHLMMKFTLQISGIKTALRSACESLKQVQESIRMDMPEDFSPLI